MRSTTTRRILLAGTFTFAMACGRDNTLLPTDTPIGADSLSVNPAKYGDLYWPYKLVISPKPVPALGIGGTVKLVPLVTDPVGYKLNATVIWTSSNTAIATVATDGTVTAKAAGTAIVRGNSLAVPAVGDSSIIVVNAPVLPASVKTIAVALSASSVVVGANAQATATLKDSLGQVLTGRTVTWMSLSPTVATVNSAGLITGVAAGTSTITATSGNVTGSATITVTAPVIIPNGSETLANLPQVYLNTTMPAAPAAGGKIISVAAGGSLQGAINAALPGDVIELANGATFTGNFTLPNKGASTQWIVIRPANMSGVPAEGSRMTPSKAVAANLPRVVSSSNQGAFNTDFGAHHWRLIGLEVTVPATIANTGLIRLGTGYETTLAQMPHDLVLDRMYVHGTATGIVRRGILLNGASSAVIDSYVSECHDNGPDSQAIAGWNGPGPFKIVNNYLEAASENINWGGADPTTQGLIPSDIEIRRNHLSKQLAWKGKGFNVKNLFEIKNAQRVLIEGNIFENNWQDGQGGSAIVLKSVNQGQGCPWCVAKDITFRYNLVKNTGSGFALTGHDVGAQSIMTRVTITDNVVSGIDVGPNNNGDGRGFLINNDPIDLVIAHNTVFDPTNTAITFGGPTTEPPTRLVFRDNIVGGGQYGVKGPGIGTAQALQAFMPTGGYWGNVMTASGSNATGFPTGNFFSATLSGIGFASPSTIDYHLTSSSPFRLRATDMLNPGADVDAVNAAIAGVIVP